MVAAFVLLLALTLLIAASAPSTPGVAHATTLSTASSSDPLTATIRRTSHGIPHILANDYAGIGFGYGYSIAQDNICVLADIYVTVDGERSRFSGSSPLGSFGPNGSWSQGGNG